MHIKQASLQNYFILPGKVTDSLLNKQKFQMRWCRLWQFLKTDIFICMDSRNSPSCSYIACWNLIKSSFSQGCEHAYLMKHNYTASSLLLLYIEKLFFKKSDDSHLRLWNNNQQNNTFCQRPNDQWVCISISQMKLKYSYCLFLLLISITGKD